MRDRAAMPHNPWRLAIGGMIALATGMGVGRFIYTPILPVMAEALSLSASEAGLIASANFLGHLVGALMAALPVFRGSRYRYLLAALAINAAGLIVTGLTDDFAAHLILRFVIGLAGAFIVVFSSALVLDRLAVIGRQGLSSVYFAGVGLGVASSAAAVAWLLTEGASWRDLWYLAGALSVAGLALSAWLIPAAEPPSAGPETRPGRSDPFALRAVIIAYGLFGFGYVITATFIVAIVRETPEIRAMEPYVWVLFGLSAAPSVALWMRVSRRIGLFHAFAIACLVEAVGVASSIFWVSPLGVAVAVIFLGGTMVAITALGLVAVRNFSMGDPRVNLALATASFGVGQAVGPAIGGWLADLTGDFTVPSVAAAGMLVLAAAVAGLAAGRERAGASPAVPRV